MAFGLDYAWKPHPSTAAIRSAGARFVCRYLSPDPAKNLTAQEARELASAELDIVCVWESGAGRALDGAQAGVDDAHAAAAQAKACGMPSDRPIYFAVDFDANAQQQHAINAYLDGAATVLGRDRVGIYGGYGPVRRALDSGFARWAWQTYAWSGGAWDPRAQIQQYSNSHRVGAADVDYNRSMKADFGQWRAGAQEENDMQLDDRVIIPADFDAQYSQPNYSVDWMLAAGPAETRKLAQKVAAQGAQIQAMAADIAAIKAAVLPAAAAPAAVLPAAADTPAADTPAGG